jgi:hypothetical protein
MLGGTNSCSNSFTMKGMKDMKVLSSSRSWGGRIFFTVLAHSMEHLFAVRMISVGFPFRSRRFSRRSRRLRLLLHNELAHGIARLFYGKRQLGFLRRAVNSWHNFPIMVNGFCFLPATPSLKGGFALFGEEQPLLNAFHVGMKTCAFGVQEGTGSADHGARIV